MVKDVLNSRPATAAVVALHPLFPGTILEGDLMPRKADF